MIQTCGSEVKAPAVRMAVAATTRFVTVKVTARRASRLRPRALASNLDSCSLKHKEEQMNVGQTNGGAKMWCVDEKK